MMAVRDLMTPNPVTVTPQATLAEVWDLMRELEIRHLPVVENNSLIGMVSDRDLAHLDIGRVLTEAGATALRRELEMPVVKVMSAEVISVEPEAAVSEVVELLVESRVGAIPVIRSGTREVVGIISYVDVLRGVLELLEES
jgi:acetoin utilization protein AcuB